MQSKPLKPAPDPTKDFTGSAAGRGECTANIGGIRLTNTQRDSNRTALAFLSVVRCLGSL